MIVRHAMFIEGKKVVKAGSGGAGQHTMVSTDDGALYACGRNNLGQLGIGNTTNQNVFAKVALPDGRRVVDVVPGYEHTVAILDDGSVYACGNNGSGQLGIGSTTNQSTLARVTLPVERSAVKVDCGRSHTVVMLDDGSVYICSFSSCGKRY